MGSIRKKAKAIWSEMEGKHRNFAKMIEKF